MAKRKKKTAGKKAARASRKSRRESRRGGSRRLSPCQRRSDDRLEDALADPAAHFHKGLDHDHATGEVDSGQYRRFIASLRELNADPTTALNGFRLRANSSNEIRNFVNPQSGWATDTEISDPCCFSIPQPPRLHSMDTAAEAIEDYWMALLRDVPFIDWDSHSDVAAAADELSDLPLYINASDPNGDPDSPGAGFERIPLTAKSVFRGGELARYSRPSAGISESVGPFISQFLMHEIPYGTLRIPQKFMHASPGIDYMTQWDEWVAVQNGDMRDPRQNLIGENDATRRRHLSTMRDLATYVHFDELFQAYLNAALILIGNGYPTNRGNPYGPGCSTMGIGQDQQQSYMEKYEQFRQQQGMKRRTPLYPDQDGFGTFGGPHLLSMVTEVATRALKAVWRQKWTLLRLRPEAYAGLVHRTLVEGAEKYCGFPLEVFETLRHSEAIQRILSGHQESCRWRSGGSGLLPMAFPEGSPTHPAYGAGHATVAGACVTILKAFFDGGAVFCGPVQTTSCGSCLIPYSESDARQMTVELELNKLAANIAVGRDMAGVHWRSDYTQSMLLGQRVAIDMLFRQRTTFTEDWSYHFNTYGGKPISITRDGIHYHDDTFCPSEDGCELAEWLLEVV